MDNSFVETRGLRVQGHDNLGAKLSIELTALSSDNQTNTRPNELKLPDPFGTER